MSDFSLTDKLYMRRCLQLARCAEGSTSPNPMVGAVIVCDNRIIGEGYHIRAGEPHAEVNAIRAVKENDRHLLTRSTIYVSLEPCSHYGKTPPCADLIIRSGIPRVVVAVTDTNTKVNGGGIARLREAGVEVVVGVLQDKAYLLNEKFFTSHEKSRPFITLKWAESNDGYIDHNRNTADEPPARISTPLTSVAVHRLRAMHDAILVGTRTALLDNPSLSVRHWTGRALLRLVIDRNGILPPSLKLFDDTQPTIVYTACLTENKFGKNTQQQKLDFTTDVLPQILNHLHSIKITSLLVEGGAKLLDGFIKASLWDCARIERNSTLILNEGTKAPEISGIIVKKEQCGNNEAVVIRPKTSYKL